MFAPQLPADPVIPEYVHRQHPAEGISPDLLEIGGEHIMSGTAALRVDRDFFGADEAITNYSPGRDHWVATLIILEADREAAWNKRNTVVSQIRKQLKLDRYRDPVPKPGSTEYMA